LDVRTNCALCAAADESPELRHIAKPKKKKIKTISKIEPERRKFFSMNEMLR